MKFLIKLIKFLVLDQVADQVVGMSPGKIPGNGCVLLERTLESQSRQSEDTRQHPSVDSGVGPRRTLIASGTLIATLSKLFQVRFPRAFPC